jgi:hypothetical protein
MSFGERLLGASTSRNQRVIKTVVGGRPEKSHLLADNAISFCRCNCSYPASVDQSSPIPGIPVPSIAMTTGTTQTTRAIRT